MEVIAHGGAGSPADEPESRRAVLEEAVACGAEAGTPLEAVCATVRVLEVDPGFNAGIGSAVQSDGAIRTDAGVMRCSLPPSVDERSERERGAPEGATREAGAACAMTGVVHAVSVARAVLTETPHVLLAGERAVEFAATRGVETGVDCWTDATRGRWESLDAPGGGPAEQLAWLRDLFGTPAAEGDDGAPVAARDAGNEATPATDHRRGGAGHDTVGAVATDGETVATATSTGGRWAALAGRVGDVPQVGAGFYAGPAGAASATGAGEAIARHTLAREAVRYLEGGAAAPTAARLAIEEFDGLADGEAGLIVMDADGESGEAYSSAAMQTART